MKNTKTTIQNSKIFARQERQLKQTPVQSKKKLAISKLTLFYYLLTVCMRCPFRYKHMYMYHGILVHNSCLQNRKKIKSIIFDIEV